MLSYLAPEAAADALRWRQSILPLAYERAEQLGLAGAAFPWRTIRGQECSGYWPAGTAAFHINADIADAVRRYVAATGDAEFEREVGLELLVETARLWRSLGHHDSAGSFRIDGVTGPDEYTAIVDNNVYTNLMAQQNLRVAADTAAKHRAGRARARRQRRGDGELARRGQGHARSRTTRSSACTRSRRASPSTSMWDFEDTPPEQYPLLLHVPYFDLYRKQVVKQADLVLAMQLRPDAFTAEQKARNFAYYEAHHRAGLVAVGVHPGGDGGRGPGHLDLAYDYLAEAALVDLHDLAGNSDHGMHIASLAGTWTAVVAGFGGMQCDADGLRFAPRLPPALSRISFGLHWHGRQLRVEIRQEEAEYRLVGGAADAAVAPRRAGRAGRRARGAARSRPPSPSSRSSSRTAGAPRARHPGG